MELLDIVCEVSDRTRYTRREIRRILRTAATIIKEELRQGRNVSWRGLGVFENAYRGHRTGRDPRTKTPIHVPAGRRLRFLASQELLQAVRDSVEYFEELDPKTRYLPKETSNGQVRSSTRPGKGREGPDGEDSWEDLLID